MPFGWTLLQDDSFMQSTGAVAADVDLDLGANRTAKDPLGPGSTVGRARGVDRADRELAAADFQMTQLRLGLSTRSR